MSDGVSERKRLFFVVKKRGERKRRIFVGRVPSSLVVCAVVETIFIHRRFCRFVCIILFVKNSLLIYVQLDFL